jgi:hypothetical protein
VVYKKETVGFANRIADVCARRRTISRHSAASAVFPQTASPSPR